VYVPDEKCRRAAKKKKEPWQKFAEPVDPERAAAIAR
jgi:hypothetical protein